jgi:hypothetical protein
MITTDITIYGIENIACTYTIAVVGLDTAELYNGGNIRQWAEISLANSEQLIRLLDSAT